MTQLASCSLEVMIGHESEAVVCSKYYVIQ